MLHKHHRQTLRTTRQKMPTCVSPIQTEPSGFIFPYCMQTTLATPLRFRWGRGFTLKLEGGPHLAAGPAGPAAKCGPPSSFRDGTPLQYSCLKIPWMEEPGGLQSTGSKESDTTERLHFHFSLSRIGEGNGNPLQCSCLENPMDVGAWWAAVYGVAQSQTQLKRLSSSSSRGQHVKVNL